MIIQNAHTDAYRLGRKAVLTEVCAFQAQGLWTKALRTALVRRTIVCQKQMERNYPEMRGVVSYYAGRLGALKSRRTADFSQPKVDDPLIVHLLSLSNGHQQERMREATVYTELSGWDWDTDMERDLGHKLDTSLLSTPARHHALVNALATLGAVLLCLVLLPVVALVGTLSTIVLLISQAASEFDQQA
jgi:hypothetical protein